MKFAAYLTAGFAIGAVAGFLWSNKTKNHIGESVTTKFDGGKLVMSLDIQGAAVAGLKDALGIHGPTIVGQNY